MFQTGKSIVKWVSIPMLAVASMFLFFAERYEPWLAAFVILGAIFFIERAVRSKQYCWAVGLVSLIVLFSPLALAVKAFLLMGVICTMTFTALLAVFRTRPVTAR